jgi:hypothetical protein
VAGIGPVMRDQMMDGVPTSHPAAPSRVCCTQSGRESYFAQRRAEGGLSRRWREIGCISAIVQISSLLTVIPMVAIPWVLLGQVTDKESQ